MFSRHLVVIRGAGDLATGVIYRLHKVGFPIVALELPQPLVVRRRVALAAAVLQGYAQVEELRGQRVEGLPEALAVAEASARVPSTGIIPVMVAPVLPEGLRPSILIDARVAKRNIDTDIEQAGTVVALGPGFTAGRDCHAVVETMRGHWLGRVYWAGRAQPNTGTPGLVAGKGAERVLRAPVNGIVEWAREIGDLVESGEKVGRVVGPTRDVAVVAPFAGVIRGLIAPGTSVPQGLKIGDVDARAQVAACSTISDKALAVGGGVVEAVITHLRRRGVGD